MYQYDSPTCAPVLPTPAAAGTPGYFTDGNPGGGVAATELRSDFMNMLMMELLNVVEAAGIAPSKTTYNQVLDALNAMYAKLAGSASQTFSVAPATSPQHAMQLGQATGRLLNVQVFTSNGTYTPTVGTTKVRATLVGGGGGGGATSATASGSSAAAGGGAAGSAWQGIISNPGVQSVTVGAGGFGGSGGSGGTGGASSFGSLASVAGGLGGAGVAGTSLVPGIIGGGGNPGFAPTFIAGSIFAARGEAGRVGIMYTNSNGNGGGGGNSIFGGGAQAISNASGNPGAAPGAGGGGGCGYTSSAATTGGAGAAGTVIIEEYA